MESMAEFLQTLGETARIVGASDLSEEAWAEAGLRDRVVVTLGRGTRVLEVAAAGRGARWAAIEWSPSDAPVLLARAIGTLHAHLAAESRDDAPRAARVPVSVAEASACVA